MPGLTDIHVHLLPGIDDGPRDVEGAVAMARAAVRAGTETIAVTPHLRSDFPDVHVGEIARRCERLRGELEEAGVALRIVEGAEVSLAWALNADEESLRLATYGQRGSDILIETPSNASVLPKLLEPLLARGLRITLAHPERGAAFHHQPELLEELRERGVLGQLNAGALLRARHGGRGFVQRLCERGLVQVIASDGHRGEEWRPVGVLADAVAAAAELVGDERALWMASAAPLAIIEGRPLPAAPEAVARRRRGWRPWR